MFEKINNVNMRFLVLSVYKVQNRLLSKSQKVRLLHEDALIAQNMGR